MNIEYNPDGGGLGRADNILHISQLPVVAHYVAACLQGFYELHPGNYKCAFEMIIKEKTEIATQVIRGILLPKDVKWYETPNGQILFELRSESGGVATGHLICYLVTTKF